VNGGLPMKADRPSVSAYPAAAWFLQVEPAALQAVAEVEAGSAGAFLDTGEPVILYERHIFHRLTNGRFSGALAPGDFPREVSELSNPSSGGYGAASIQHAKLAAAVKLDREAALKACSWGLFQILGLNHAEAGYPSLQGFITAMYRSADDHLRALVMFLRHDERLVDALRGHEWAEFARVYNGPAYQKNRYDAKLAAAYARLGTA
jgi:N-acetylmuramidase-like protein